MKLSVTGKPNAFTDFSIKEAKYATRFWANILFGSRLAENISLNLRFGQLAEDGEIGHCIPYDHDNPNGCREFLVSLEEALPRKNALRVLAHELEHVRQFARRELRNDHGTLYYWSPNQAYYRLTQKNANKMPWEKQACFSEKWLLQFYSEHCKMYDIRWFSHM